MSDNVKVVVRLRPLIQREINAGLEKKWIVKNKQIYQKNVPGKIYSFDQVFGETSRTSDVYNEIAAPIVSSVMQGFNGTVFAYGQTASGKTFTMMGNDAYPGIVPLAVEDIFAIIERDLSREFIIRVSYLEIYNESVIDLLREGSKMKNLDVREDNGQVFVAGLREVNVKSFEEIIELMRRGEACRHFGVTNMNERSSRSHTIFRIMVEARALVSDQLDCDDRPVTVAHLNLVDLAGSEKAGQTGATGQRLTEGGFINKSLFTLGQVISQLSEGSSFISYRDSKLTRILQNALGGNSKTVIIANITPAVVDETHSTLRFATSAKRILNKPVQNEVLSDEAQLKRCKLEIMKLKKKLSENKKHSEVEELLRTLQEKERLHEEKLASLTRFICVSSQIIDATGDRNINAKRNRRQTWCPGKAPQQILLSDNDADIREAPLHVGSFYSPAEPQGSRERRVVFSRENDLSEVVEEFSNDSTSTNFLFPVTEERYAQTEPFLEDVPEEILKQKELKIEELTKQLDEIRCLYKSSRKTSCLDCLHKEEHLEEYYENDPTIQKPDDGSQSKCSFRNLSTTLSPVSNAEDMEADVSNFSTKTVDKDMTQKISELMKENYQLREEKKLVEEELFSSQVKIEKLIQRQDELQSEFKELEEFTRLESDLRNASILEKQHCMNDSYNDMASSQLKKHHAENDEEFETLNEELLNLKKQFTKVLNEKNDLESLLEMDAQKFRRREKELCDALEAAHIELQSAQVVPSGEDKEITTDAKMTQTDRDDDADDSHAALRNRIDELTAMLASVQEEKTQLANDIEENIDVLVETQSDIRKKTKVIVDLEQLLKEKDLEIQWLQQAKVEPQPNESAPCPELTEEHGDCLEKQTALSNLLNKSVQCSELMEQYFDELNQQNHRKPSVDECIQCDYLTEQSDCSVMQQANSQELLNKSMQCDLILEEQVVSMNKSMQCDIVLEEPVMSLDKSIQCDNFVEKVDDNLEQRLTVEKKCYQELEKKYNSLLAQSTQAKQKLLAEENQDLGLKRRIDELEQIRKELTETISILNTEDQAQIDKLNKEVLKLHNQLAKAQAGEGLATGRLKKAEEENENLKQEIHLLEAAQTRSILPTGHQDRDPEKMADRISKLSVCLDLTRQRCDKYEARIKELEVTANKAENAMFARDNLQHELRHLEELIKDREQELSAVKQRYGSSFAEMAHLRTRIVSAEQEVEQKSFVISDLEKQLKQAEDKLNLTEELNKTEQKRTEELETKLKHLEEENRVIHQELEMLKEQSDLMETEKEKLAADLEKKIVSITSLEEQLKQAEDKVLLTEELNKTELKISEELETKLKHLEEENRVIRQELEMLKEQSDLMETEKEKLATDLEKKCLSITSLEEQLKQAEDKLLLTEELNKTELKRTNELETKLREIIKHLQEDEMLKEQNDLIDNEKEQLATDLEKKNYNMVSIEEQLEEKLKEAEVKRAEDLESELQETVKKLQDENKDLRQELDKLKEQVDFIENEKPKSVMNLDQDTIQASSNPRLHDIIAENDCLQREQANLLKQLEEKTCHFDELIKLIEALNSEKDSLSKEKEQFAESLRQKKDELNQLIKKNDELEQEKELLMEQLLTLEDLQRKNHQLLVELTELEAENNNSVTEREKLKEELLVMKGEKEQLLSRISSQQPLVGDDRYKELCSALEKITAERNVLQTKLNEATMAIENLKTEVQDKENSVQIMLNTSVYRESNNQESDRMTSLEEQLQQETEKLEDVKDKELKKNEDLRTKLEEVKETCQELQETNKVLHQEVEALKEQVKLTEDEKQKLTVCLEQATVRTLNLDEVISESECLQKEKASLISQLEEKTHQCDYLTELAETLKSDLILLKKEKEQDAESLMQRNDELNQLTMKKDSLEREKESLMERLQTLEGLQKHNQELMEKLTELESERHDLLMERQQMEKELSVICNKNKELLSRISSLEQLESERNELAHQLLVKDEKYRELCSSLEEVTAERHDLQKKVDESNLELERVKSELEQKEKIVCDMLDEISEMETKYQQLASMNQANKKMDRDMKDAEAQTIPDNLQTELERKLAEKTAQYDELWENFNEVYDTKEKLSAKLLDVYQEEDEKYRILEEECITLRKTTDEEKVKLLEKIKSLEQHASKNEANEKKQNRTMKDNETQTVSDNLQAELERKLAEKTAQYDELWENFNEVYDTKEKLSAKLLDVYQEEDEKYRILEEECITLRKTTDEEKTKLLEKIKSLEADNEKLEDSVLRKRLHINRLETELKREAIQKKDEIQSLHETIAYVEEKVKYYRSRVAELEKHQHQPDTTSKADTKTTLISNSCSFVNATTYYLLQAKNTELEKNIEKLRKKANHLELIVQKYHSRCSCSVRVSETDMCTTGSLSSEETVEAHNVAATKIR